MNVNFIPCGKCKTCGMELKKTKGIQKYPDLVFCNEICNEQFKLRPYEYGQWWNNHHNVFPSKLHHGIIKEEHNGWTIQKFSY